jgi:hypothetical protein
MADKQEEKDKKKKKLLLQQKYTQRITTAKQGREFFLSKDYVNASKKYHEYLGILAELYDLDDIYSLKPSLFDPNKDVTEMLLISHVFWEMARINEMTPKLQATYKKCLSQFVKFTINQPYQVFNSEMLRKYIKKNKNRSIQLGMLNEAYSQIFVQSRKCYIATFCFNEGSDEVRLFRVFKNRLLNQPFGIPIVRAYYLSSSQLVSTCENYKIFSKSLYLLAYPVLKMIYLILRRSF